MPRITLSFKLPEEEDAYTVALRAPEYHQCIGETLAYIRSRIKYEDLEPNVAEALEAVRGVIYRELDGDL